MGGAEVGSDGPAEDLYRSSAALAAFGTLGGGWADSSGGVIAGPAGTSPGCAA